MAITPLACDQLPLEESSNAESRRQIFRRTKLCKFNLLGKCNYGDNCSYAHESAALTPQPDFSRTRLCRNYAGQGTCAAGDKCRFAHGEDQLRNTPQEAGLSNADSEAEGQERWLEAKSSLEHVIVQAVQQRLNQVAQEKFEPPVSAPGGYASFSLVNDSVAEIGKQIFPSTNSCKFALPDSQFVDEDLCVANGFRDFAQRSDFSWTRSCTSTSPKETGSVGAAKLQSNPQEVGLSHPLVEAEGQKSWQETKTSLEHLISQAVQQRLQSHEVSQDQLETLATSGSEGGHVKPPANIATESRKQLFRRTKLCKFNVLGKCNYGDDCLYAHGAAKLAPQPDFSRTRLCKNFAAEGTCAAGDKCRFAHGEDQLRSNPPEVGQSTGASSAGDGQEEHGQHDDSSSLGHCSSTFEAVVEPRLQQLQVTEENLEALHKVHEPRLAMSL